MIDKPSIPLRDIEQCLQPDRSGSFLLRPCDCSHGFIEVDPKLVDRAFKQIVQAVAFLECGVTEPEECAAETLLLQIFQNHARNGGRS